MCVRKSEESHEDSVRNGRPSADSKVGTFRACAAVLLIFSNCDRHRDRNCEVLTAEWHRVVLVYRRFRGTCCPDDGGSKHLWNVGKLPDYTALQPRRQPSSSVRTIVCVAASSFPVLRVVWVRLKQHWIYGSYTLLFRRRETNCVMDLYHMQKEQAHLLTLFDCLLFSHASSQTTYIMEDIPS
jgi:hypothetical protein